MYFSAIRYIFIALFFLTLTACSSIVPTCDSSSVEDALSTITSASTVNKNLLLSNLGLENPTFIRSALSNQQEIGFDPLLKKRACHATMDIIDFTSSHVIDTQQVGYLIKYSEEGEDSPGYIVKTIDEHYLNTVYAQKTEGQDLSTRGAPIGATEITQLLYDKIETMQVKESSYYNEHKQKGLELLCPDCSQKEVKEQFEEIDVIGACSSDGKNNTYVCPIAVYYLHPGRAVLKKLMNESPYETKTVDITFVQTDDNWALSDGFKKELNDADMYIR